MSRGSKILFSIMKFQPTAQGFAVANWQQDDDMCREPVTCPYWTLFVIPSQPSFNFISCQYKSPSLDQYNNKLVELNHLCYNNDTAQDSNSSCLKYDIAAYGYKRISILLLEFYTFICNTRSYWLLCKTSQFRAKDYN